MSSLRRARKRDDAEEAIVEHLRGLGYRVELLDEPCDLLVFHPSWGNFSRVLEVKTPHGKKQPKARVDKRQGEQIKFLRETGTPVVTTKEEAEGALRVVR